MARKKLARFKEFAASTHGFEFTKEHKGNWKQIFNNEHPIVLELGCGQGEYTIALAKEHSKRNYIGIDIQGERLWYGVQAVETNDLTNAMFLRAYIDHIDEYFAENEVDEIWITFPDPQPRKKHIKKRLTSPRFLEKYKQIIKPNGMLHLKTDDAPLFDYSLETLEEFGVTLHESIKDIDNAPHDPILDTRTFFEEKFRKKGRTINYCRWSFK